MIRDLVEVPATTAEGYPYASAAAGHQHAYLLPALDLVLEKCAPKAPICSKSGPEMGSWRTSWRDEATQFLL